MASEKIVTPDPSIAGSIIEALKLTVEKESLRELYSNLLAKSMNIDTAQNAHPAFVEILKQLTSDEAKIYHIRIQMVFIRLYLFRNK